MDHIKWNLHYNKTFFYMTCFQTFPIFVKCAYFHFQFCVWYEQNKTNKSRFNLQANNMLDMSCHWPLNSCHYFHLQQDCNHGNLLSRLMSLLFPIKPKKSFNMMLMFESSSWNWPSHAIGQSMNSFLMHTMKACKHANETLSLSIFKLLEMLTLMGFHNCLVEGNHWWHCIIVS
jgi:hypothetical protein